MAGKKQLGIFFDEHSVYITETDDGVLTLSATIPHTLNDPIKKASTKDAPGDVQLTANIQKFLRDNHVTTKNTVLSLPTSDIIFRTFVIPWVNPHEVESVISFEVRKYMPFKLEDLSYAYFASDTPDETVKRLQILFVGVENTILAKYSNILKETGLKIVCIEPAPISLIRALMSKQQLRLDETLAIVHTDGHAGNLAVAHHGIPQFIRDFSLRPAQETESNAEAIQARLFSEIRISIDYYIRKNANQKVDGIIAISQPQWNETIQNMTDELNIPVMTVSPQSILGTSEPADAGLLTAFGSAIRQGAVSTPVEFDLTEKAPPSLGLQHVELAPLNYKKVGALAAGCVAILMATFFLFTRNIAHYEKALAQLQSAESPYQDLTTDDITLRADELSKKLIAYKSIPIRSQFFVFSKYIPEILPDGTWLRYLSVKHSIAPTEGSTGEEAQPPGKISIDLDGYAYTENSSRQMHLINALLANLKSNQKLFGKLNNFQLLSAQKEGINNYEVTAFKIRCD